MELEWVSYRQCVGVGLGCLRFYRRFMWEGVARMCIVWDAEWGQVRLCSLLQDSLLDTKGVLSLPHVMLVVEFGCFGPTGLSVWNEQVGWAFYGRSYELVIWVWIVLLIVVVDKVWVASSYR